MIFPIKSNDSQYLITLHVASKQLTQLMFREVGKSNSEQHIATAYRLTDEFESRYLNSVMTYEPELSELISNAGTQATVSHPFRRMIPVDVPYMRECRTVLNGYIKYYKGDTKNKPKQLRAETDAIHKAEKFKIWAGQFPEGSDDSELCPEKHSPKKRTVKKLGTLCDYLDNLLDIAINNGGSIPMSYRNAEWSPRFYATGAFNLQSCPKLVRNISLHRGIEYDITSANQTIMLDYARRNGLPREALAELVTNKDMIFLTISNDTRISIDNLKPIFLAICNNAQLVEPKIAIGILWKQLYKHKAVAECQLVHDIARILWRDCRWVNRDSFADKYTKLYEHKFVQSYIGEIDAIANHMLDNIPDFLSRSKGTISSALANYNQSIEVMALREIYGAFPTAQVPIHDAVICTESGDIELAQHRMESVTGVKFRLRETPL